MFSAMTVWALWISNPQMNICWICGSVQTYQGRMVEFTLQTTQWVVPTLSSFLNSGTFVLFDQICTIDDHIVCFVKRGHS